MALPKTFRGYMKNRLRQLRTRAGLTQRKLAEIVGTSQQQIQRIEAGRVAARLNLASKLSKALKQPLDALFPSAAKPLKQLMNERSSDRSLEDDDALFKLAEAGIEADPRNWTFRVLLRGHDGPIDFVVSPSEQRRLFNIVQDEQSAHDCAQFVVFDAEDAAVALNLRELMYCHFLFDIGSAVDEAPAESREAATVYFNENKRPHNFPVEPDIGSPSGEDDEGEFRGIFRALELHVDDRQRVSFTDVDGETVFLRTGDIALLEVPMSIVDPDFQSYTEEADTTEAAS